VGLIQAWDINAIPLNISKDPVVLNQIFGALQTYKPYPQFGSINLTSNFGHNTYHGATVRVEKRYSKGLALLVNYTIQKNDYLKLDIFTNKGERIVDPNPQLTQTGNTGTATVPKEFHYLVDLNGIVKLPLIGEFKLEGLTLRQAEEIVQKEYDKFFVDAFVILTYANKRVVILGSPGGQVIPLNNQNVHLAEVLALAKGIDNNGKAHIIRVMRKDKFFLIDFKNFAHHAIQKCRIMADEQERASKVLQKLLEPNDGIDVQMIGGLIEQQQIRV